MSKFPVGLFAIVICLLPGYCISQGGCRFCAPGDIVPLAGAGGAAGWSDSVVRCSASRKAG